MGGHGGLNILPQKRWNVYNFDNREKVRRDEEEAAKEEQLKQEQVRKREAESRLERLRSRAHGSDPFVQVTTKETVNAAETEAAVAVELEGQSKSDSNHINLFEGIKIFDPVDVGMVRKKDGKEVEEGGKNKKMKKEAAPRVVGPEDETHRLGYGIAGKGVKAPWYMTKPSRKEEEEDKPSSSAMRKQAKKEEGKRKTLEELREERLKRENKEKERVRALMVERRVHNNTNSTSKHRGYYTR